MVKETPSWPAPMMEIGEKTVFWRTFHWGTIFAYVVISVIGSISTYFAVMWMPIHTIEGFLNLIIFLTWNFLTMMYLFSASYFGPGYVPKKWKPEKETHTEFLQYCQPCQGYKVPRSHHCSKCNRCCMKMDHHCPWINNCVGHRNHGFFLRFLFFAIVGCLHALVIDFTAGYYGVFAGWYLKFGTGTEPIIILTPISFVSLVIAVALALAVAIALTILLVAQSMYVLKNMNAIEEYIDGKARSIRKHEEEMQKEKNEKEVEEEEEDEKFTEWIYPYNLGWKLNIKQVFTSPFDSRTKGNGTWWPTRDDCNQFTFTIEQLMQKQLKRDRARELRIVEDFSAKFCAPKKYGWRVFMKQPVVDGKMLKVTEGEGIVATRGTQGWVYGYRQSNPIDKGWVPMKCTNYRPPSEQLTEKEEEEEKKEK